MSKLERAATYPGLEIIAKARDGAGGPAGGAAEGIQPTGHVTLCGSRMRPNTPKFARLPRCS